MAGRRALACAAMLLALVSAVAAAAAAASPNVTPAKSSSSSSSSSSKHGCSSIAGCKSCSKSGCTACKTGADLVGGRCNCPAGYGQYGTANTVPAVTSSNGRKLSQVAAAAGASSSTKPAHGSSKGKGGKGGKGNNGGSGGTSSFACGPCAPNAYSATSKVVSSSRCTPCPAGTTSPEGSNTCFVDPGFYYDNASGTVNQCAANKWCPGGDFQSDGRAQNNCPSGSTSPVQSSDVSACTVPPGSYYDEASGKVVKCPVGSYCPGGSVTGDGKSLIGCPAGSTTAAIGASTISQCTVPPGSYYDGEIVQKCPENTYCPGGSITGAGSSPVDCPQDTTFPATGASTLNECIVNPGFYWTGTAVAQCPEDTYCDGGPIGSGGSVVKNCPVATTSAVQSDTISDCQVPPGKFFDGTNVVTCPAGDYCTGGSVTGDGAVKTQCPANSDSAAGSDAKADCLLDAGYYCMYTGTTCAVTLCAANKYCPGGVSVTNVGDDGSRACPTSSVSVAGSDAVADCKLAPGTYCSAYTTGVCSTISTCLANKYCPGGSSVKDIVNNGQKNCPANTQSVAGSDAKADCTLNPGYYCIYDVNDVCAVTICPATNYCPGGASVEDPATPGGPIPCPEGQTSNAGASVCVDICSAGQLYCSPTCVDPQTDSNNCGSCGAACGTGELCDGGQCACGTAGNFCPTGSSCQLIGATLKPTCVCSNTGVAVSAPLPLTCDTQIINSVDIKIYELDVTPGLTYGLSYDAFTIPDRFVVTDGAPCGPILIDTAFVGSINDGCAQSAPCCAIGLAAGCTGTPGDFCPAAASAIPQPGGGQGGGFRSFVPTTNKIFVVGYGVCTTTGSVLTIQCPP